MRCLVLHLPKYMIFYLKLLLYRGPNWFRIMGVTNTLKVTVKKKGRRREEEGKSLIFFGSQSKSITKLLVLTFYPLYHLLMCKLVLWISRASIKNAVEIHVVLNFFQHLASNMLIRGEAIRRKSIYPSIFAVPSFPQMLKEINKVSMLKSYFQPVTQGVKKYMAFDWFLLSLLNLWL